MTFEEHIRTEHNMWHYLYFIVLIKVKDPTEFTGPESYVHQMVKVSLSTDLSINSAKLCHLLQDTHQMHFYGVGFCSVYFMRASSGAKLC